MWLFKEVTLLSRNYSFINSYKYIGIIYKMLSELNQQTLDNIYAIASQKQQQLLKSTLDDKNINKEVLLLSQFLGIVVKLKLIQTK